MALVGDLIFAGQGPRLVVLDISNPAVPRKISESDVLPGLVDNVIVRNGTAYITAGKLFMQLDVSDPVRMLHQGQTELPSPGRILLRDNIVYAGGQTAQFRDPDGTTYESYIATVDVSGEPKLVGEIVVPYDVATLALAGNQLFIGHDQGISRLDVSDLSRLSNPVPGPRVNEADILRVYGSTLLVGGYSEIIAYDVADPQAPEICGRKKEPSLAWSEICRPERLYLYCRVATGSSLHANKCRCTDGRSIARTRLLLSGWERRDYRSSRASLSNRSANPVH